MKMDLIRVYRINVKMELTESQTTELGYYFKDSVILGLIEAIYYKFRIILSMLTTIDFWYVART